MSYRKKEYESRTHIGVHSSGIIANRWTKYTDDQIKAIVIKLAQDNPTGLTTRIIQRELECRNILFGETKMKRILKEMVDSNQLQFTVMRKGLGHLYKIVKAAE